MNSSQNLTLLLYLAACYVVILQEYFIFCEQVSLIEIENYSISGRKILRAGVLCGGVRLCLFICL